MTPEIQSAALRARSVGGRRATAHPLQVSHSQQVSDPSAAGTGVPEQISPRQAGGFRLSRFELYNWGTFNGEAAVLHPGGESALLTGANGSGKSTIVDGLLTLLVPSRKRNYNLSAGSDRRERSEQTYVRGAYQREQDKLGQVQIKYLRGEAEISALLGQFCNPITHETVTFGQIFWFDSGSLKKLYLASGGSADIHSLIGSSRTPDELRKRLRSAQSTTVFPTFSDYEQHFLQIFGLRSPKALDLFNQITTIKQIGYLDEFVRQNMLDAVQVEGYLDAFYNNYENLTQCHRAIVIARRQLEELAVIGSDAEKLRAVTDRMVEFQNQIKEVPRFLARTKLDLLGVRMGELSRSLLLKGQDLTAIDQHLHALASEKQTLKNAIMGDRSSREIEHFEMLLQNQRDRMRVKTSRMRDYLALLKSIDYGSVVTDTQTFVNLRQRAEQERGAIDLVLADFREREFSLRAACKALEDDRVVAEQEWSSANQNKSRVPRAHLDLRQKLCERLQVARDALPFAAELMAVREDQKEWAGAIERLLYGFAMRMLLPTEYFVEASRFLRSQHLGLRIVLEQVDDFTPTRSEAASGRDADLVVHKLRFHPKAPYAAWVKFCITRDYGYRCVDDLRGMHKLERCLTKEGLLKRNFHQLEKDDRSRIDDASRHILGWSNEDRLQYLLSQGRDLTQKVTSHAAKLKECKQQLDASLRRRDQITLLLQSDHYEEIDSTREEQEISRLTQQKHLLQDKSSKAKQLAAEVARLTALEDEANKSRDGTIQELALLENEMGDLPRAINHAKSLLDESTPHGAGNAPATDLSSLMNSFFAKKGFQLTLNSVRFFDQYLREVERDLQRSMEQQRDKQGRLSEGLVAKMMLFKTNFSESATDLRPSIDYLGDFILYRKRLEKESLPEHEARFKKLLSRSVINDMTAFKSTLEIAYERIEEDITRLNESLRLISYAPRSHIQLRMSRTKDVDIREFQSMVRNAIKTERDGQNIDLEESFQRVKKILDKLKNDSKWSQKVTDVRNWADFLAAEIDSSSSATVNIYADSAGLSGGQKAKLAFTILGSAIAYQYGLNSERSAEKSLRFVIIDEAFSKSDDTNSRYAMELFQKLGLQLIVVTPSDKIHVIEPFVRNVFVTHMEAESSQSKLYTMLLQSTPSSEPYDKSAVAQ